MCWACVAVSSSVLRSVGPVAIICCNLSTPFFLTLQCVVVFCNVLQRVVTNCRDLPTQKALLLPNFAVNCSLLQCIATICCNLPMLTASVLLCFAMFYSVLQLSAASYAKRCFVAVCGRVWQRIAVCRNYLLQLSALLNVSVLQFFVVFCNALQLLATMRYNSPTLQGFLFLCCSVLRLVAVFCNVL